MYAAQAIINSEGVVVLHRRKLKVSWMFVALYLIIRNNYQHRRQEMSERFGEMVQVCGYHS
jgi:hypothetical protein